MHSENRVDFTNSATQTCPFAAYDQIRPDGPFYVEPSTGYLIVTRYDLVKEIVADPVRYLNQAGALQGVGSSPQAVAAAAVYRDAGFPQLDVLVSGDAPDHNFHRSLVDKAFTVGRVRQMGAYLQETVDFYIDRCLDRGSVDFQAEVADMIPTAIIADQLGVPRSDLPDFKRWSDASVAKNDPSLSVEEAVDLAKVRVGLLEYLDKAILRYQEEPADCLLSDMIHADVDGRKLSRDEAINIAAILIVAGNETTTSAISNCMIRMIEGGFEEQLRSNPASITEFVEEELRLDAPIQGLFRRTAVDVTLDGVAIPAGTILNLRWGAANRDPEKFVNPNEFDINRGNKRQHITFGYGKHFCVGTMLARAEINITLETVLRKMKNIRFSDRPDAIVRKPNYITFGVRKLFLDFDRA
jgi:cytochrome P450